MKNKIAAAVYRTAADTIEAYHMIEDGAHIVVGLSGGADSVCLNRVTVIAIRRNSNRRDWFKRTVF